MEARAGSPVAPRSVKDGLRGIARNNLILHFEAVPPDSGGKSFEVIPVHSPLEVFEYRLGGWQDLGRVQNGGRRYDPEKHDLGEVLPRELDGGNYSSDMGEPSTGTRMRESSPFCLWMLGCSDQQH